MYVVQEAKDVEPCLGALYDSMRDPIIGELVAHAARCMGTVGPPRTPCSTSRAVHLMFGGVGTQFQAWMLLESIRRMGHITHLLSMSTFRVYLSVGS